MTSASKFRCLSSHFSQWSSGAQSGCLNIRVQGCSMEHLRHLHGAGGCDPKPTHPEEAARFSLGFTNGTGHCSKPPPAFLTGSAGNCFNLPPLPCWMGEGNLSLNLLSNQFNTLKYNVLWPIEFPPWSSNCWPCFYSHVECLIFHWSFLRYLSQFHLPGSSILRLVLKT